MAGSVKLLKLVKLLSLAENHSLSKEECLKHLCVTENEFESICSDLKSLGLGVCVSDEKISIFHPYEPLDEDLLFRKSLVLYQSLFYTVLPIFHLPDKMAFCLLRYFLPKK